MQTVMKERKQGHRYPEQPHDQFNKRHSARTTLSCKQRRSIECKKKTRTSFKRIFSGLEHGAAYQNDTKYMHYSIVIEKIRTLETND